MNRISISLLALFSLGIVFPKAAIAETAKREIEFNRDIRPILAENCFACHGPDSGSRKADLRLDQREAAIERQAIVPQQPDHSMLIERIFADGDDLMPPRSTKKSLTDSQKALLRQWIAQGARYQPHWSFLAPRRGQIPQVKQADWVRNPLDAFVLASLESVQLEPAPIADRRTLARRLSLDLIGLPPQPEAVDALVNDPSEDAYEKYVDHLLASPHWGEHRGRYWLDAARYADTHGIHHDNYREMWTYRDWVIQAFNKNQPFDQFTRDQLAGDLLATPTEDQLIATGFNRCNITTNEGGAIDEEYLVLYTRDRTETTAQVWLGLTAGCAVCHDHKFDPLSQREFYQLAAFFNNTTQNAMDGNVSDTPPVLRLPAAEDRQQFAEVTRQLARVKRQMARRCREARDDFADWLAHADRSHISSRVSSDQLELHLPLADDTGNAIELFIDGKPENAVVDLARWQKGPHGNQSLLLDPDIHLRLQSCGDFDFQDPFTMSVWIKLNKSNQNGAIIARMDEEQNFRGWDVCVQDGRIGMHLVSSWPGDAVKVVAQSPVPVGQWHHVLVCYDGTATDRGVSIFYDGEQQKTTTEATPIKSSSRTSVPLQLAQRNSSFRLKNTQLHDVRLYKRALSTSEIVKLATGEHIAAILRKDASERTSEEENVLYQWWLNGTDPVHRKYKTEQDALLAEKKKLEKNFTVAYIMQEKQTPAAAHVLVRGEYDRRAEQVSPKTPEFLPPMDGPFPKNRLGLAQWLTAADHPLTARVTVNRFWQELFGVGLVRTAGDFGISGELPVNQPLLDWLAVEFRESGWDTKRFYKLLVMSNTYRQAAITTQEKLEQDPENRLLSRGPRFRMDAEMVRDYALATSGLLVPKLGGPSVKPYQPPGVWEAVTMYASNTREYVQDTGDKLYRRSVYTFYKRSAPPASLDVFNAPSRETCTVRRERTNTPLQALATLNDVQMVEAARHLAQAVLQASDRKEARLKELALRLLAREFSDKELRIVDASLSTMSKYYQDHRDDAARLITVGETKPDASIDRATLAAWTALANQLMNLDEVLNK